jgi:hypothetical protein
LELGNIDANFYLGVLYDWYAYPEKDFEQAREYYEACGNNPNAEIALAINYQYGQGGDADTEKAQSLIQSALEQGSNEAYFFLAEIAYEEEDYDTALQYFTKALDGSEQLYFAAAMNEIGYMYLWGDGVEQDYATAMEWFEKSADLGNKDAMSNIAYAYSEGLGVEQDYAKAMEWYEESADLGNATAMYNIGWLYIEGDGVEQDYNAAMEWFKKAADIGDTESMVIIGKMYSKGYGVEQDNSIALEWYEKAENLGDENGRVSADNMRQLLN